MTSSSKVWMDLDPLQKYIAEELIFNNYSALNNLHPIGDIYITCIASSLPSFF